MILVTGATGSNGVELLRQLSNAGVPVRALVRDSAKAHSIQMPGVEIIVGDLADTTSLEAAMVGIEKVFLLVGNVPNVIQLNQNAIEVAKKAGISHLVRFSVLGAAPGATAQFLRDAWEIDQLLETTGLNYTIVRPNAFFQNALTSFAPTIASSNAFYLPVGEGKISQVDIRDIAAVAVAILTSTKEQHYGKIYEVTGPEALSYYQVADIYNQVLGRPITYIDLPSQDYRQSLLGYGLPESLANDLIALNDWYKANGANQVTNSISEITGKTPITYRQFVEDYQSSFK